MSPARKKAKSKKKAAVKKRTAKKPVRKPKKRTAPKKKAAAKKKAKARSKPRPKKKAAAKSKTRPKKKPAAKKAPARKKAAVKKPAAKKRRAAPAPAPKVKSAGKKVRTAPAPKVKSAGASRKKIRPAPSRGRVRQPVAPIRAVAQPRTALGEKWTCFTCDAKFYDLNRPEPLCPKCGANQHDRPKTPARASTKAPARRRARAEAPMAPLLEEEDATETVARDEAGLDRAAGEGLLGAAKDDAEEES